MTITEIGTIDSQESTFVTLKNNIVLALNNKKVHEYAKMIFKGILAIATMVVSYKIAMVFLVNKQLPVAIAITIAGLFTIWKTINYSPKADKPDHVSTTEKLKDEKIADEIFSDSESEDNPVSSSEDEEFNLNDYTIEKNSSDEDENFNPFDYPLKNNMQYNSSSEEVSDSSDGEENTDVNHSIYTKKIVVIETKQENLIEEKISYPKLPDNLSINTKTFKKLQKLHTALDLDTSQKEKKSHLAKMKQFINVKIMKNAVKEKVVEKEKLIQWEKEIKTASEKIARYKEKDKSAAILVMFINQYHQILSNKVNQYNPDNKDENMPNEYNAIMADFETFKKSIKKISDEAVAQFRIKLAFEGLIRMMPKSYHTKGSVTMVAVEHYLTEIEKTQKQLKLIEHKSAKSVSNSLEDHDKKLKRDRYDPYDNKHYNKNEFQKTLEKFQEFILVQNQKSRMVMH